MLGALFFSKSEAATLLIALGIGYIVTYLASREDEKSLKKLGLAIGISIILVSGVLLLAKFAWRIRTCTQDYMLPLRCEQMLKK